MGNVCLLPYRERDGREGDSCTTGEENEPSAVTNDGVFVEAPEEELTDQTQKKERKAGSLYCSLKKCLLSKGIYYHGWPENIKYPVTGSNSEQGTVIVKYIITANGEVKDPVIVRSCLLHLINEALRVVSVMPRWNPWKGQGKAVSVYYILYLFALNTEAAHEKT